jgi:hypothetical protein
MQKHWYNETTHESYVYRPDIAGGGVPLEADGSSRSGFVLMPDDWEKPPLPEPPPPPDFNQWRYTAMLHFESVFSAVQVVNAFRSTALVNMIMGLPSGDIPSTITVWNETMGMIDAAPLSADFNAIEAAAVINHIPFQVSPLGIISERTA